MAPALRRIGVFVITVVLASIAVFTVIAVLPGDPAEIYAGTQATPNQVANLRKEYGLDASIPVRYGRWVSDLVRGDLGKTFISKRSIASEIRTRLAVTLPLVALSMLLALAIALPFGVLSAIGHRRATGAICPSSGFCWSSRWWWPQRSVERHPWQVLTAS